MGPDAMILVFWMLSFKPTFSLSSFTFIKRLFRSSLLSVIRMVPSAYLRLLLLLPEIWEQWPHKRLTQTCLWVCRSLWWRRGLAVACRSVGGTECGSACIGPFEGGRHYLHYLHHSLVSGQTTGREHSPTHQQKMDYRSNQSILKEISPEYSLEGLMLKLKLQYLGHLMRRTDSLKRPWCWERLKAGGEGDDRGWDGWMASSTQWTWVWASSGSQWRTGSLVCCSPWGHKESDMTEWLNWTEHGPTHQNKTQFPPQSVSPTRKLP